MMNPLDIWPITSTRGLVAALLIFCTSSALPCDFDAVKKQIDNVIELDQKLAARFRAEVAAGFDSYKVLNDLIDRNTREQVDACRWEVAEYLTKRGFPPSH